MFVFISALLGSILFSFFVERFVKPAPPQHCVKCIILQSLIISQCYLLLSLIVQRPIFSALAISIFLIIVVAVNNAKYKALKEPLVFSDFAMFSQAFKHPRLYFPFLGMAPVIIAPVLIIGLIILVIKLEPALPFVWQRFVATLIASILLFIIIKRIALSLVITGEPEKDNQKLGLINSLIAYLLQASRPAHKTALKEALNSSFFNDGEANDTHKSTPPHFFALFSQKEQNHKPNITVIQSESFFDARRLHPNIKTDLLSHYDRIKNESILHGELEVPAWGANTMRSEFSFLTGLPSDQLGLFRFYPYQFLKAQRIFSIASFLKNQGYYCVCIHPHPASFFGRDKVFPQMGFDAFIDSNEFKQAEKFGPYISDKSVTEKILEVTKQHIDKPLFIFAITMENHGPLHLEKTQAEELKQFYTKPINTDADLNDLSIYLRHLRNADLMIETLTNYYRQSSTETRLCFYGDHIPSLPGIYQIMDYRNPNSDYFIWSSKSRSTKDTAKSLPIENLALELLSKSV